MLVLLIVMAAAELCVAAPAPGVTQAVAAAERGFDAMAQRENVRAAFLANLAEDAWMLLPYPSPGRPVFENAPPSSERLHWQPSRVLVSASGDFALSTGAWERGPAGVPPVRWGHFVSIWTRDAKGHWSVAFDGGISHVQQPLSTQVEDLGEPGIPTEEPDQLNTRWQSLVLADSSLSKRIRDGEGAAAFEAMAAGDLWLYREGQLPSKGRADLQTRLGGSIIGGGPMRAARMASSADLAFTLGGDPPLPQYGGHFRLWRWRGQWQLLLDLTLPAPPASKEPAAS